MPNFVINGTLFAEQDFAKSGISQELFQKYLEKGYIKVEDDGYKIFYPELYQNIPTEYFNNRAIKGIKVITFIILEKC